MGPASVMVWSVLYAAVNHAAMSHAAVNPAADGPVQPAASAALGLALVPMVAGILAYGTRRSGRGFATCAGTLAGLAVGVVAVAVIPGVLPGLVMALATIAAITLGHHRRAVVARSVAVAAVGVVSVGLIYVSAAVAFGSAAVMGLTSVAVADEWSHRR